MIALILWLGITALISIPKESSPSIKFGIIQISTFYPWVNPVDMDNLITDEIEQAVKDISGIDKIDSTSQVWVAFTTLTLKNDANTREVLTDVKAEVDKVRLPSDAEDPVVTEISTDNEVMFQVLMFGDRWSFPTSRLKWLSQEVKNRLEGKFGIVDIWIDGWAEFELKVEVDQGKAEALWITLSQIANTLRSYNQNTPLGNFEIDSLTYDFRVDGELVDEQDLLDVPLTAWLKIRDIASITREYNDESLKTFGQFDKQWFNVTTLTVNKAEGGNIFQASIDAKWALEKLLATPEFAGIQYVYSQDLSETIKEDYAELFKSFILTFVWVFCCLLLFVWLKEASIATFAIPLAFMITFVVLQELDYSLNFLTNFSLVLTLGIAIDTTIVIIEWAYENLKMWYNPKTAVLIAVRDFKAPLIAGTMTTLVVFIPMMVLPGILGKFLAYIPITVFITLIAALFVSLTVNSALFYKLSKPKKRYVREEKTEKFLSKEDLDVLIQEREGKEEKNHESKSFRQRALDALSKFYETTLRKFLSNKSTRLLSIFVPIILLVLTFVFLSPKIWFTLFPWGDQWIFQVKVENVPWSTTEQTAEYIPFVESELSSIPEVKQYSITVNGNALNATIELLDLDERVKKWMREVFDIEKETIENLWFIAREWLTVESVVEQWWPPQWKPVWLNLTADDNSKFSQLIIVAKDFAAHLRTLDGTKNVSLSSKDTPWQFIFSFDRSVLSSLGLTPSDVTSQLAVALNGANAGTISLDSIDADIKVLYDSFTDEVSPNDITNTMIITQWGLVPVSELMDYTVDNAVGEISRKETKIAIKVDSDLEEEFIRQWTTIQAEFTEFAQEYNFPAGLSFDAAWESDENAELIAAAGKWFLIALFLMLVILVLQFNSFRKPAIILYSVFLALLGVNIGLFLTWNPYSMPFAIWFIALTGIVVNDAIIFIDKINKNLSHGLDTFESIIEAWRSRLQPIILTTLTTLLGVLPIALQDEFWAWLGYTMIFGLFAGSAMTLFVIPSLVFVLPFILYIASRFFRKYIINILFAVLVPWILSYIAYSVYPDFKFIIMMAFWWVSWAVMIYNYTYYFNKNWGTVGDKLLGLSITNIDGSNIGKIKWLLRMLFEFIMIAFPFIVFQLNTPFKYLLLGIYVVLLLLQWMMLYFDDDLKSIADRVFGTRSANKEWIWWNDDWIVF